jgi:hypothetical protein
MILSHDHWAEAMLASMEEIDESIYVSDEDDSPHTPEIIAQINNQLSVEQLNAMSDGEDGPVAADSQNGHLGFRKLFAKLHRQFF